MKQREYVDYVQDILTSIDDIKEFIKGQDFESFLKDKKTKNAVIRSIEVIAEAAKYIPASIKNNDPDIPWTKIKGMRNKMIHEYFGIDEEILWKVAVEDIPPLRQKIKKILDKLNKL